jgi:internalin A
MERSLPLSSKIASDESQIPKRVNRRFWDELEKRSLIYSQTKATFDRLPVSIPEPLRLLARIPAFRIFVTTTFDPWMERALVEERFGGRPRPLSIGYSPGESPDLTDEQLNSQEPIVFQLFGRISSTPYYGYGVTEEDLLLYVHLLQVRPPKNLCNALRDHHLLFVGNSFSDWLARFFVRTARGDRLSATHGKEIFIVDDELRRSSTMTSFFQGFCWETNILAENTPVEFVRLLYEKWFERHPAAEAAVSVGTVREPAKSASHSRLCANQPGACSTRKRLDAAPLDALRTFISYARQGHDATDRVIYTLERLGLKIGFDRDYGPGFGVDLDFLYKLPREERVKSIQTLDLSGCGRLWDLSPLAGLSALRTLNLSFCHQLRDLALPAGLSALQTLKLFGCYQLRDLSPLAGLSALQTLDLSGWVQLWDLSPLAGLSALQTLNLLGCYQLTGLSPLAGLTSLQTLDLSGCWRLSGDLSPLAGLTSLQTLNLSGCKLLSDLSPLAGLSSLQTLILSGCEQLSGDLSPLAGLQSLQTLNLSGCGQLSGDLNPLAGLQSLQTLDLSWCSQLSGDLSPLAGLQSLQTLNLSGCTALRQLDPIKELLPSLQVLYLFGCKLNDLPSEICGEEHYENVLDKVRAHYEDLKSGQRLDAEVKVLFLGDGGTGKTQLCRRLRGESFDPSVPTTHGIQLSEILLTVEDFPEPVRLNLWDFGGQEVYHGSHALFLQGQAAFLILWTPKLEQGSDCEGGLTFQRRPLRYWLDYLRAFAGSQSLVLVIQSQCDRPRDRVSYPPATTDDLAFFRKAEVGALTGLGLGLLRETLKEAVRDCFDRRPPPPIGAGRVRVRDRLRQLLAEDQKRPAAQRQYRLLERADFDRLCDEEGGISDKEAMLNFLHHSGVIFYRPGLFDGRIVLDQNWALEAIYSIFDRRKALPLLQGYGRFTRVDLEALIWSDYTPKEQEVFLSMMKSCGICFSARRLPDGEWEYIAPELLPAWSDAQEQLLGRLREDPPTAEAEAHYPFLHEGILRGYLSKIGQHAKDAPVYWKYGCWFYEKTTKSQMLIESQWDDSKSETGPGKIRFQAWGDQANALVQPLLEALQTLPVGHPPDVIGQRGHNVPSKSSDAAQLTLEQLEIPAWPALPPAPGKPEVFVSYAWGDDSSQQARERTDVVDRLCQRLTQEGWNVLCDNTVMRPGELISGFMKRIGRADHVIVILSDKYLQSTYCMTELHALYERSVGEKEDFLRRVIPLTLQDAQIGTWRDRVEHGKYWKTEFAEMAQHLSDLGVADFALYKAMQDWANHVSDILAHVNDVLHPHGFEAIVKDDFAALRQMLQQARSELHS